MPKSLEPDLLEKWKVSDAVETYRIRHWGKGYFGINKAGHVTVHPYKHNDQTIDLKELVDDLQERGFQLPILIRFTDILRHRVGEIHDAFERAVSRREHGSFGIGLWVARQLVDAMHGKIHVTSRPARGSIFTVILPLSSAR